MVAVGRAGGRCGLGFLCGGGLLVAVGGLGLRGCFFGGRRTHCVVGLVVFGRGAGCAVGGLLLLEEVGGGAVCRVVGDALAGGDGLAGGVGFFGGFLGGFLGRLGLLLG